MVVAVVTTTSAVAAATADPLEDTMTGLAATAPSVTMATAAAAARTSAGRGRVPSTSVQPAVPQAAAPAAGAACGQRKAQCSYGTAQLWRSAACGAAPQASVAARLF